MKLHLLFVGKTAFPELESAIDRYLSRLRHYIPTEIHVIKPEKITDSISVETVKEREAARILRLYDSRDYLVAWDQKGRQVTSEGFAQFWKGLPANGHSGVWMVLGGPVGLSHSVIQKAQSTLSFSKMTFPHDLARLMLVEQLYRAFSILRGEPYHK